MSNVIKQIRMKNPSLTGAKAEQTGPAVRRIEFYLEDGKFETPQSIFGNQHELILTAPSLQCL